MKNKKDKRIASLHTHSSYSLLDAVSSPFDIIDKAIEYGYKAIAFTEHSNIYNWIKKKQYCDKKGIKYIHGCEFYLTETLDEKIRDNYHVILLARNIEGVYEINELVTRSTMEDHFYYRPRISLDEFLATSDNIIRLSACIGGVLGQNDPESDIFKKCLDKFDYIEVQPHICDEHVTYNKMLAGLGKPLVATGDFHEADAYRVECRLMWKKGVGTSYPTEDRYDLSIKSYDDFRNCFIKQGALTEEQIDEAISNTVVIADLVEDFNLDYSFKFPQLYDEPKKMIRENTYKALNEMLLSKDEYDEYVNRIETELHAFDVLNMESFILFMSELMTYCVESNIAVGPARGSASGSLVCYLLKVQDVNPMVWGTNFTRFINVNRISLPDIDTDFAPSDRQKVFDYIQQRFGLEQSAHIATFTQVGVKTFADDIGRALDVPLHEIKQIKDGYEVFEKREKKIKKQLDDFAISEEEYKEEMFRLDMELTDYMSQYEELFKYYEGVKGAIRATGIHAAGMIGSPINICDSIGLMRNNKNGKMISTCDMKSVDSLNYVKYDILSLATLDRIRDTYKFLGRKMPRSSEMDWNDEAVFESMAKSPVGLFQFESEESWKQLIKFGCHSVRDIAFVTAVIRPSCASFRENAIARIPSINPSPEIDEVLKDSIGYLVYQEQQISFLQKLCGFTEGEADVVRRAIGKKSQELLDEWLPKIEQGYINNSSKSEDEAREEFQQFLKVFMDAVNYSFSYNHAIAYSMITYMTAYARHYHPLEFIASYLNNATCEEDIVDGTALAKTYGVSIEKPRFGYSTDKYSVKDGKIWKGIESILNVSSKCGTGLYELSKKKKFTNFHELISEITENGIANKTQINVLISIGYFSDFGPSKTLLEWYERFLSYKGRKQISKTDIPSGLQKIIMNGIANSIEGYSETKAKFKVNSEHMLSEILRLMPKREMTTYEKIVAQLSYLGYIQDEELLTTTKIGNVMTGKTRLGAFKVDFMDGTSGWYKFLEGKDPERGDAIVVYRTTQIKRGRYTDKVITSYDKLILDRNKKGDKK